MLRIMVAELSGQVEIIRRVARFGILSRDLGFFEVDEILLEKKANTFPAFKETLKAVIA